MSSKVHLDLAHEVFRAVGEQSLPRLMELTDPDVEWSSFFTVGEKAGVYHGHEGLERYIRDLADTWEMVNPQPEEGLVWGPIAMFVGRIGYRGRGSGVEGESPAGWVFRFRANKVCRFRAFRDPEAALESVGLPGGESTA